VSPDEITDAERYPTLTDDGRAMLRFLREHPHAPIFRNESGNRLTMHDVERVSAFEREVLSARVGWSDGDEPAWIQDIIQRCYAEVPFYRRLGTPPAELRNVPTITRGDLGRDIAQFVPDSAPIERLINFRTSGTTGHPLLLASHPVVAASYLAFHKRALRRFGIELQHGRGQVGVVLLGIQRECFTYVSVTPTMEESGLAKINLHEGDWRRPDDRGRYLEALAPEVIAGDPLSFAELLRIGIRVRPRALLCTSMALSPALRAELEASFACPVLDLYSLNEAGPVAVFDERADGHVMLQHRMFVELLGADGEPVKRGERGEITLTGGFNFCLPLLRYRTGDHASLQFHEGEPVLVGLEGRPPVRFRTTRGAWINNIEVTHALRRFPLAQFVLHQGADGALRLRLLESAVDATDISDALLALFGAGQRLEIERVRDFGGKVVQYTSDVAGARP
jgi:phenylacetate-coenzyme A ligase PaaK-like adenylate-forming protein